jgi:hypothetical protein
VGITHGLGQTIACRFWDFDTVWITSRCRITNSIPEMLIICDDLVVNTYKTSYCSRQGKKTSPAAVHNRVILSLKQLSGLMKGMRRAEAYKGIFGAIRASRLPGESPELAAGCAQGSRPLHV